MKRAVRAKKTPGDFRLRGLILLPAGRNSGNRIELFPLSGWTGCLGFRLESTQLGPGKLLLLLGGFLCNFLRNFLCSFLRGLLSSHRVSP
jgi:hypothetical protein